MKWEKVFKMETDDHAKAVSVFVNCSEDIWEKIFKQSL